MFLEGEKIMLRSAARSLAIALLAISPLAAAHSPGVTREFKQSYPLQADGTFELSNVNGTVRIEGWDKDVVEVSAVKTTQDKESLLDLVAIDVDSKPGAFSISTRYPQESGVEVAVEYTIHVPRRAHLNHLSTVNGTLRLTELDGIGDLHTVNGNIEIFEGRGNVHAHTTNGNVYLELRNPADSRGAFAETTNGSVLLAIPTDLHADLEARCMNGSFSSELPFVMQGATQPRVLHGKLGHGGLPIHLGTVNGGIRIVPLRSTI
jgi:hypothetical protein